MKLEPNIIMLILVGIGMCLVVFSILLRDPEE